VALVGGVELTSSAPRTVVFDWCLAAKRRQQNRRNAIVLVLRSVPDDRDVADFAAEATKGERLVQFQVVTSITVRG
jgi:hypothetical protein